MTTVSVVTAAVIERDGRSSSRGGRQGVHLEGHWEFPGGKCEPGESLQACLARELREELASMPAVGEKCCSRHRTTIPIGVSSCISCAARCMGEPAPQLGQEMRWVRARRAGGAAFPAADAELIRLLIECGPRPANAA